MNVNGCHFWRFWMTRLFDGKRFSCYTTGKRIDKILLSVRALQAEGQKWAARYGSEHQAQDVMSGAVWSEGFHPSTVPRLFCFVVVGGDVMAKTKVIRARVEEPIKLALVRLAGGPRKQSETLRLLVIEGLKRRGLLAEGARDARAA